MFDVVGGVVGFVVGGVVGGGCGVEAFLQVLRFAKKLSISHAWGIESPLVSTQVPPKNNITCFQYETECDQQRRQPRGNWKTSTMRKLNGQELNIKKTNNDVNNGYLTGVKP